jgi:cytochrome c
VGILKVLLAAVLINLTAATIAVAGGTEKEALAMLDRGIAYIKVHGSEEAFKAFSDPANKEFHDRDLYIYAYDFKGFNIAHGANKAMIGKNFLEMKDAAGKVWYPEMVEIAKAKGGGSTEFMWTNPETKKIQAKTGYVRRIPGQDAFLGTGIYK